MTNPGPSESFLGIVLLFFLPGSLGQSDTCWKCWEPLPPPTILSIPWKKPNDSRRRRDGERNRTTDCGCCQALLKTPGPALLDNTLVHAPCQCQVSVIYALYPTVNNKTNNNNCKHSLSLYDTLSCPKIFVPFPPLMFYSHNHSRIFIGSITTPTYQLRKQAQRG